MKHTFKFLTFLLLFALSFGFNQEVKANADIASVGAVFSVNNNTEKYAIVKDSWLTCTNCTDWTIKDWTAYNSHNFGNVSSFKLKGVAVSGWRSGSDWFAAKIFYKIYKSGSSEPGSNTGEFGAGEFGETRNMPDQFICEKCYSSDGSDKSVIGMDNQNVDLIGSSEPGVYNMKIYTNTEKRYNGGSWDKKEDYAAVTATFTIMPKVTFNANGGSGSMNAQYVKYNENDALNSNTFTAPTGYRFKEWKDGSGNTYADGANIKTTANITLTAQWEAKTYTLTLDNNGGTITSGQNTQTVTVTYDASTITGSWEVPTKIGYAYKGYFTSTNKTNAVILQSSQAFSTASTNPYAPSGKWNQDGNRTVFAKWDANKYTLRLSANGGTGDNVDISMTYDADPVTLPKNTFTRTGYAFAGWNTKADGSGTAYVDEAPVKNLTTGTAMTYLYAQWTPNKTTITLDRRDGSATKELKATYDGDISTVTGLANTDYQRTGYTFDGIQYDNGGGSHGKVIIRSNDAWAFQSNAGGGTYTNGANPPVWKYVQSTLTLYTYWTAKQYTLTLNDNGGTGGSGTTQVTFDAKPANVDVPNKVVSEIAQIFTGYYYNDVQIFNNSGAIVMNAGSGTYTDNSGNWKYDGELELTAKWEAPAKQVVHFGVTNGTSADATSGTVSAKIKSTGTDISSGDQIDAGTVITITFAFNKGQYTQTQGWKLSAWYAGENIQTAQKIADAGNTVSLDYTIPTQESYVYAYAPECINPFNIAVNSEQTRMGSVDKTSASVSPNTYVTITATPNNGYSFVNWTQSGTDFVFADGAENTDATTKVSMKNVQTQPILTANFKINEYTITYEGVDGATNPNSEKTSYTIEDETYVFSPATKTGYQFAGWTCNDEPIIKLEQGVSYGDKTITATWTPNTYYVKFNGNGNTSGEMSNQQFAYDAAQNLTANTFARTGYTFQGWDTDPAGTTVVYENSTSVNNLSDTQNDVVNLYAVWQINTYTITYPDASAQKAGNFTIKDAPATAKYQETVTFTATPIYGYAGSVASVTAGGVQLSRDGDTYTFVMGAENVTINVSNSSKRVCKITASCPDNKWGTLEPTGTIENTDMFEKHKYTFNMNTGYTFMKWNIANAKCAPNYTERSYPEIEIIATSENATISPAILETYTNVTLNFEPTYMGYIKLNGNNIASGTKTDVSLFTTATIEACTNYGYKFVGWTATNNEVITLTEPNANWQDGKDMNTSHKLAGVENGGKTVLTAHFEEDIYSGWELNGNLDDASNWKLNPLNKRLGETDQHVGYYTQYLNGGWEYQIEVKHGDKYFGCPTDDWIIIDNCAGFVFENNNKRCNLRASASGDYVFRVDFSDENKPKVTVLYPDAARKINGDQIFYFYSKYNESVWSNPIFRIGNESYAETRVMSKVPGTTHLWQYRIRDGWCNYKAIQIANNHGYSGTGKASDKKMIYNMGKKGTDTYYISDGTEFLGGGSDITKYKYWEPFGSSKGDYETNYYTCYESTNPNENATRKFNRNVVKPTQVANGTIKVEQWLSDDGSNRELISDYTDYGVSPSRWITITATPEKGYRVQKISVTTAEENGTKTEDYYKGDSWNYVVHKDITNITATFVKIETWSWYVKNDPTYWVPEGKDVYLYYWHHLNEGEDVPYWGWPGQMCTKMDDTKTWYKVELTNAYFDISTWKLNEGEGENPRQTVEYSATEGDFTPERMNGKYYEIYLKDDKWQVRPATGDLPTYYRMEIIDGQNTFYSNTVSNTTDIMSFYAGPSVTSVKLQKGTSNGWTSSADLKSQFKEAGVWTAKVANADGTAITTLEAYTGKYYIRTDGADGGWENYKVAGNAFTSFSPREGESFSYYWVATVGKADGGETNVKAKIANEYNNHLSVEIVNDKNTDEYGNIDNASFGSNIRFSYEPTTNAFEREIISGSAGDVYLNIVGENLYSDISCEGGFALNEANYNSKPKESKLADISDWVYEKTVYVKIPNTETAATVELRSLYNNQRTALYKGDVMQKGTSEGVYKIRLTYDFKKNRIITSWSPSSQEITQSMVVDADIMFLQVEKGDVSQISIAPNTQEQEPIKVSSLDYLLYVLEIEQGGPAFEHYRISLPFDCRISDIYGIGGFDVLWGIQEYDGKTRSEKGWLDEKTNYWRWLTKDETLKAGVGYSITVDKGNLPFKTIEEEVTRTICDPDGTNCKDVTTYENRAALRLYFPSSTKEFTLSRAQNGAEAMQVENWVCNIPGRTVADANWHFMGSTGYNNIKITSFSGSQDVPYYLYVLNADETAYEPVSSVANDFSFRSFKAYMFQFTGTINWAQYTRSEPEIASAPRYSATQHTPQRMRIDVMENDESAAHAYIAMDDKATFGFDQNQDLAWMNSNSVAQVYTESENEPYAANCVPFESAILPMTVKTLHAGDYTLHLEGADKVAVYLIDYQLQTETLISAGDVEVELGKGSSSDRFALRFDVAASPTDSKNAKGETIINDGQKTQKLLINDQIYLINGGRVYNVLGVEE